jgi:hypothetical protein
MKRLVWLLVPWIAGMLASCGGGSSGDSVGSPTGQLTQPSPGSTSGMTVLANVYSYPDGYPSTPGFYSGPSAGANSTAYVSVGDYASGMANTGATVVVNGTSLPFDSARQAYFGSLTIAPGAMIDVSVTAGINVYRASMNQFASLQAVTSPPMASSVAAASALSVTWTSPTSPVSFGDRLGFDIWVADAANGAFVWSYPPTEVNGNSFVIPAGSLSVGNRLIGLLAATCSPIVGAVGSSGLCVGAIRAVPITVSQ